MAEDAREEAPPDRTTMHDWGTPGKRIAWLLLNRFQGNRSAMGRATGLSHTAISKVASAGRPPGRRFLTAIAEKLGVDAEWLLRGVGEPFTNPGSPPMPLWMPVSDKLFLERMPDQLGDSTDDTIIMPSLRSSSQFWYRLRSGEALLAEPNCGFLLGDLLLMETDPTRFPPEARLTRTICAVKSLPKGGPTVRLGAVTFHEGSVENGPARLEVDTFDPCPADATLVEDLLFRRFPDGTIKPIQRKGRLYKGEERGSEIFVDPAYDEDRLDSDARPIKHADIVAVWTGLSLRYPYMTYA